MTNKGGLHVALVPEGGGDPDATVASQNIKGASTVNKIVKALRDLLGAV